MDRKCPYCGSYNIESTIIPITTFGKEEKEFLTIYYCKDCLLFLPAIEVIEYKQYQKGCIVLED
jgi:hypothetical protein